MHRHVSIGSHFIASFLHAQLAGASYMDIHASGGGIYYTVSCVHKVGLDQLAASFSERLSAMMKCGTTHTVEAKSCVVMPITTISEFHVVSIAKLLIA